MGEGNAYLAWAIALYLEEPDVGALASEGITDGPNDKKIDFIYLDRDANRNGAARTSIVVAAELRFGAATMAIPGSKAWSRGFWTDMLIAVQALAEGTTLVTANEPEVARVKVLTSKNGQREEICL